jgi:excinuclease UvrABC ATPase subunit
MDNIEIINARTNNLKNLSLKILKRKITVVTGVSGSGKSSLVFDTIASQSQRLLNETFSSYIQQLLPHYEQPKVDSISNLPVSIIINQNKINGNARSTVGTITDIYSSLRLLFSRAAQPFIGYSMVYSFNSPEGMCPECKGLGVIKEINIDKLINFEESLNSGAVQFPTFQPGGWRLTRYTESGNFDNDKKIKNYTPDELSLLLYNTGTAPLNPTKNWHKTSQYTGIIPRITKAFIETDNSKYKKDLDRILTTNSCPSCQGTRLNEKVRSAKILGCSITDCVNMSVDKLLLFLDKIKESGVERILEDLNTRLRTLQEVGLNYLTLNRSTTTLSGGESQRIKMTKHLNSSLSDILYIFDELSTGLHPEDLEGIIKILYKLKKKGNSIILVDHDPDIIKIADNIVNLGEEAGVNGGYITYQGTYKGLLDSDTITAKALNTKHYLNKERKNYQEFYELHNVSLNNIKNVSVKIPKNAFTVVTGVAGSGKSTLIRFLFKKVFSNAVILDQSPIHTTHRSNALSYLGVFDILKTIFSKISSQSISHFSYNAKGACPVCKGKGYIKLDLAFLGDTRQICESCQGKRFNTQTLSYYYKNKNIDDVLNLTIKEAYNFFDNKKLKQALNFLITANLGYISLGQSLDTFSGGELQRLKIAKTLYENNSNLLILDEPSTGLHESDTQNLLELFLKLIENGNTLIVLEHNLSIISQADWIIDLGPRGGSLGGKIVFQGYPADLIKNSDSLTAKHLRKFIK